jgi:hypothetical protein
MDAADFTQPDIPALRRAARFLRRREPNLPAAAHPEIHQGVLTAALWLDDQADILGTAPAPAAQETRRPIFNQLVAPAAGGPVFHDQAKAMLDAHENAIRAAAGEDVLRLKAALLALHPKTETPPARMLRGTEALHGPPARAPQQRTRNRRPVTQRRSRVATILRIRP